LAGVLFAFTLPLIAQVGTVRIRVFYSGTIPVKDAEVAWLSATGQRVEWRKCDENGEIVWANLTAGIVAFSASSPFASPVTREATIAEGQETDLRLDLEFQYGDGIMPVEAVKSPLPSQLGPSPGKPNRKHWWTFWRH
jgi:hypothetical protein